MTPQQFRARLAALNLTITSFSALTGVHRVRATKWGVPDATRPNDFPAWVPVMLGLMERVEATEKIAAE